MSDTDGDNTTITRGELLCTLRVMEKSLVPGSIPSPVLCSVDIYIANTCPVPAIQPAEIDVL